MIERELTTGEMLRVIGLALVFSFAVGTLLWEVIKGILDNWRS